MAEDSSAVHDATLIDVTLPLVAGLVDRLERGIEVLKEQRKTGYSSAYWIAASYAELGDSERAFEWLNIAYQEHDEWLLSLRTERSFDPIRSDPRFAELMRKVGLPP